MTSKISSIQTQTDLNCNKCEDEFESEMELENHIHGYDFFQCKNFQMWASFYANLEKHAAEKHNVTCKKLANPTAKKYHNDSYPKQVPSNFLCDKCHKDFKYQKELKIHIHFVCVCGMSFHVKDHLQTQMRDNSCLSYWR